MPCHGYWNRHVDTHHAHLNASAELPCHIAIAGEAAHTVAELVRVDQINRTDKVRHAHAAEHRSENLFFVNAHVGGDVVKQCSAYPVTIFTACARVFACEFATIHKQVRTLQFTSHDVSADSFISSFGDDRAHFSVKVNAVFDFQRFGALCKQWHDFIGHITHQYSDRNRHATLTG